MWNVHRHLYALLFALMPFVRVGRCCEFLEDVSEDVCACPLCVCRSPGTFRVECASSFVRVAARGRCCEFLEDVSEDVVNSWKTEVKFVDGLTAQMSKSVPPDTARD